MKVSANILLFRPLFSLIGSIFFLSLLCTCKANTKEEKPAARLLNVKDFHAQGDGLHDDTENIQAAIRAAQEGDTVYIPKGIFRVRTLILKSKLHIYGVGELRQDSSLNTQSYSRVIQNSSAPLFFGRNIQQVSLSFRASTMNEAVYISKSSQIHIAYTRVTGNREKTQAFPGMLFYECDSVEIEHSLIQYYGAPRQSHTTYQAGTGLRFLSCHQLKITHNQIQHNGENGIFMHASGNAVIDKNYLAHNGMSGIQIGFGKTGHEHGFSITNNLILHNAADAIDINNKISSQPLPIQATIAHNRSWDNGFVNQASTVDGSGIATLVNVSDVTILQNQSLKSNRPALYLQKCGEIRAEENATDNKIEIVESFGEISLLRNRFDALTALSNARGKRLLLRGNVCRTLLFPNGISIDSLILEHNRLRNTCLNLNLASGSVRLSHNLIESEQGNGAILLSKVDRAQLDHNRIRSTKQYGITISPSAQGVALSSNRIEAVNACIYDQGSPSLQLTHNQFISIPGGTLNRTVVSYNPNQLKMNNNSHRGGEKDNSIRLEGTGTAWISDEKILSGYPDYGKIVVKEE